MLMTAWGKGKVVGTGNTCIHDLKINQELVEDLRHLANVPEAEKNSAPLFQERVTKKIVVEN